MHRWIVVVGLLAFAQPALAAPVTPDVINTADFTGKIPDEEKISPLAVKVQVLLDRAHFSPGEIDGRFGDNVEKALLAYAEANSLPAGKALTPEIWSKLIGNAGEPMVVSYTITEADVAGPYLEKVPSRMDDMKDLKALGYGSLKEALAERFHMSQALLSELNPGQKFTTAGEVINVLGITPVVAPSKEALKEASKDAPKPKDKKAGKDAKKDSKKDAKADAKTDAPTVESLLAADMTKAARLEVDKDRQTVKAFAADGSLLAFYPASVGSDEKPTPSGTLKVMSISADPHYRYDPKYKFKTVKSTEPFTIKPGPNNPVGAMWIALSEKSYGIHGTAEPSRVSKSESHGCIRLTNWDVLRLGHLVRKGVEVVFVEPKKQASK